jgi:hypothetical protein
VVEAGRALGLPVAFLCVVDGLDLPAEAALGVPVLPIRRHLFPPWCQDPALLGPARDIRMRALREARREHRNP